MFLGKPLPTELLSAAEALQGELEFDDTQTLKAPSLVDDEYINAGLSDPKIMITTSR